jgi:hypothetical protein
MAGSSASSNSRCDSTCDSFTSSLLILLKLVSQVWWALGHMTSPDYYGIVNGSLRERSAARAVTNGSVETQTKRGKPIPDQSGIRRLPSFSCQNRYPILYHSAIRSTIRRFRHVVGKRDPCNASAKASRIDHNRIWLKPGKAAFGHGY